MSYFRNRSQIGHSEDPLMTLIDGSGDWKLSRISALYNLHYTAVKLKQYASKIKQDLSVVVKENTTLKTKYKVTVLADPSLRRHEDDPWALCISVHITKEGTAEAISYTGILMSWGAYETVPLGTHLPFLLERGRQQIGDSVKLTLCKMFDCHIAPVYFNKEHMMQFALVLCQMEPSVDSKPMKFIYKVPGLDKGTMTLTVGVPSIMIIHDSYKDGDQEELTNEELMAQTYAGLQRHIFYTAKMDISVLELSNVFHPHTNLSSSGAFSVKSLKAARAMLELMNDLLIK